MSVVGKVWAKMKQKDVCKPKAFEAGTLGPGPSLDPHWLAGPKQVSKQLSQTLISSSRNQSKWYWWEAQVGRQILKQ